MSADALVAGPPTIAVVWYGVLARNDLLADPPGRLAASLAVALSLVVALGVFACEVGRPARSSYGSLARTDSLRLADSTVPVLGVLVGAGDIARCHSNADDSTGRLLKDIVEIYRRRDVPVLIFTAGDNAYPLGRRVDYKTCYDPAWGGPLKDITRPSPGNHDFEPRDDRGYFEYFGKAAGEPDRGYYEYEFAGWDIFSLNSDVLQPGVGSTRAFREPIAAAQSAWLGRWLKEPSGGCSIAYWHHPRWSSGLHGNDPHVDTLWRLLYATGAEIVINGHDHLYERFKPLRPDSTVDEAHGLVEFVVGTGGGSLRRFPGGRNPGISAKQVEGSYGVLVLELEAHLAHYRFVAPSGETLDRGEIECHGRPEHRADYGNRNRAATATSGTR